MRDQQPHGMRNVLGVKTIRVLNTRYCGTIRKYGLLYDKSLNRFFRIKKFALLFSTSIVHTCPTPSGSTFILQSNIAPHTLVN